MKKLLWLLALLITSPAFAGITSIGTPPLIFTSPDTAASLAAITCENWSLVTDGNTGVEYREDNCAGTPTFTKVFPLDPNHLDISSDVKTLLGQANIAGVKSSMGMGISDVSGLSAALSAVPSLPITQSNVTGLVTALATKPTLYSGGTAQTSAKVISKHANVSSGTAVFYLTDTELSSGTALCPNAVIDDSINVYVNDATASYQWSEVVTNSNKTLTVTINKLTTANILTGILGQSGAPNGTTVRMSVACY